MEVRKGFSEEVKPELITEDKGKGGYSVGKNSLCLTVGKGTKYSLGSEDKAGMGTGSR